MKQYYYFEDEKTEAVSYDIDQYEAFYNVNFGYELGLDARYIEQREPDYQGNPLIEALPPLLEKIDVVDRLEKEPKYEESERFEDDNYRIHAILRIRNFFHIFLSHLNIETKLSIVIRRGYVGKIIQSANYRRNLLKTSDLVKKRAEKDALEELKCISLYTASTTPGFTIYGPSGAGKSVGIQNILAKCYPQYLIHTNYHGQKMIFHQIVWLKIECSYNGGIKGICKQFFRKIDSLIGTNHLKTFADKGKTVDDMIAAMAHVAQLHGLGALIIDELQHITGTKNSKEEVLNFLVTLQNEIKLPIIFIGTYKLVNKVLTLDFRQARRATGIGEVEIGYLKEKYHEKELKEWDDFINALWEYQWTKEKTYLTDELKHVIYNESIGIVDRVVTLYMLCQIKAIVTGKEKITAEDIKDVSENEMKLSKGMIEAFKRGDIETLRQYADLNPFDVDSYAENAIIMMQEYEELKRIKESEEYRIKRTKNELIKSLKNLLISVGIEENQSNKIAIKVVTQNGINTDQTTLNGLAMREAFNILSPQTADAGKKGPDKKTRNRKKEEEQEMYCDAYKKAGKVKSPETDFNL